MIDSPHPAHALLPTPADQRLQGQWLALVAAASPQVQEVLQRLGGDCAAELANGFYTAMLEDEQTQGLLAHTEVNARLNAAMQRWIRELLSTWSTAGVVDLIELQRHVGTMHARVNVPISLVLRGARALKRLLIQCLSAVETLDAYTRWEALVLVDSLIDMAIEVMSSQYVQANEQAARSDEAYRSFASSANMSLERERQRTALLDWESRFLQELMMSDPGDALTRLGQSPFGLWIQHKAVAVFHRSPEMTAILDTIRHVDHSLLPQCQQLRQQATTEMAELRRLMRAVLGGVEQIRFLMSTLFDHLVDMEAGRDALTQLLNRRFLPAILAREIDLCRRGHKSFSLLLIDADHFKRINDQHGHTAGDRVLQHLAGILVSVVRSGDFVFRFGGEEFMVLSVETEAPQAVQLAEKLRQLVQQERFPLPGGEHTQMTISVGVAIHDGHPDYQRLVERADQALYRAKQAGRNRVESSEGSG